MTALALRVGMAISVAMLTPGCGDSKKAAEGPLGAQVKAVETAKGLEADVNAKVEDTARKADEAK